MRETMAVLLSQESVRGYLSSLTGWRLSDDERALHKHFSFKNFNAAFGWMTHIALQAEKMDHHPEWTNIYKNVDVRLTTHEAGGITELDIKMAKFMNDSS
jgi:4a-hydroxytetrahydrobiopterin dehydratase